MWIEFVTLNNGGILKYVVQRLDFRGKTSKYAAVLVHCEKKYCKFREKMEEDEIRVYYK